MEVWYATCSEADGTGWWFHHELVSPSGGQADGVFVHGWVAMFPAAGEPVVERFGPDGPIPRVGDEGVLLRGNGWSVEPGRYRGRTATFTWDVGVESDTPGLYTFPRWAWEREVLPGAQIVDVPRAWFRGKVDVGGSERKLEAFGAQAHIYGRGSAARWAWLHADLDEDTTLEVVAAVPHLPLPLPSGVHVPALPVVRLRFRGRDESRDPLLSAICGRARLGLPSWSVQVPLPGARKLVVTVDLPAQRCVQMEYPNPDGSRVWCTNSERADARVQIEVGRGRRRHIESEWHLTGRAHAEVGQSAPWEQVATQPFPR